MVRIFRRNDRGLAEPVRALISMEGNPGVSPVRLAVESVPEIRVKHVIEHKPKPRPTVIQPIISGGDGREMRTPPINCEMRHSVPVYFPMSWLTGRDEDISKQCALRLELHYDPQGQLLMASG